MDADQTLSLRERHPFDRAVIYVATGLFALTILLATTQVTVRLTELRLDGVPLHWTEPLARFTLIIATYIGAAVASRNDEHIKMNYFPDRLARRSPHGRAVLDVVVSLVVMGFVLVVLRGTVENAIITWDDRFGAVQVVSSGMIFAGISVGFALMLVYESSSLVSSLRTLVSPESQEAEA